MLTIKKEEACTLISAKMDKMVEIAVNSVYNDSVETFQCMLYKLFFYSNRGIIQSFHFFEVVLMN